MRTVLTILLCIYTLSVEMARGQETQPDQSRFHKSRNELLPAAGIEKIIINNRHGHIIYTGWKKDSISVNINIWVEAPFQGSATDVHNKITSSSQKISKSLTFRTSFDENFHSNYNFGIDYHIYGPEDLQLELTNQYGNIDINHTFGSVNIKLDHGDLSIQKQRSSIPAANISIKNGNLSAEKLTTSEIQHSNGQIKIGEVGMLTLNMDFTSGSIKKVDNLRLHASTGKLNVGEVGSIDANTHYTYLEINELLRSGQLDLTQGSLSIEHISKELKELTISAIESPVALKINRQLAYSLHGEVYNGMINHSEESSLRILKESNVISFSGQFNADKSNAASIILFGTNCSINIDNK